MFSDIKITKKVVYAALSFGITEAELYLQFFLWLNITFILFIHFYIIIY